MSRMMPSVLHLRSSAGMYGAEHLLLGLCQEQARLGQSSRIVAFAAPDREQPALLAAASARAIGWQALRCRGPVDAAAVLQLRRLLAAGHGVDVLHCHDYKSIVYGALASADLPVARVATLHGWLDGDFRLRFYRFLERRALRGFERICAVSPAIEQELIAAGLRGDRICRVDNGVDTRRFRPAAAEAADRDPAAAVQLGCAARLSAEKNLAQLIVAVAECRARGRQVELTIHGDGPLRSELERLVIRLGLRGSVRLPGAAASLETWYPGLDAFVLPSLTEGMPMSVLEAMACGCPVLASAVGAIPELLSGVAGCCMVPAGDQDALVDAMMAIPRRREPRLAARQRVLDGYSVARMAEQYQRVYADALMQRRDCLLESAPEPAALARRPLAARPQPDPARPGAGRP
jgi:L-malate glycosyltransferase